MLREKKHYMLHYIYSMRPPRRTWGPLWRIFLFLRPSACFLSHISLIRTKLWQLIARKWVYIYFGIFDLPPIEEKNGGRSRVSGLAVLANLVEPLKLIQPLMHLNSWPNWTLEPIELSNQLNSWINWTVFNNWTFVLIALIESLHQSNHWSNWALESNQLNM